MGEKPRQPQDKYIIRMPDGLRERIARKARANRRSMNSEIVEALELQFPEEVSIRFLLEEFQDVIRRHPDLAKNPFTQDLLHGILKELREALRIAAAEDLAPELALLEIKMRKGEAGSSLPTTQPSGPLPPSLPPSREPRGETFSQSNSEKAAPAQSVGTKSGNVEP